MEVMKIMEKLNVYLSNLAVWNVKLHNLHWNVVGVQFVALHNFTEELYDDVFQKFDDVAEYIKMNGGEPLAKLSDYLDKTTMKELSETSYKTQEVLDHLKEDLELMNALAVEIRNEADEKGDFVAVGMFEEHVEFYKKQLWFIESMKK